MSSINDLVAFQKMEDLTVILHKMLARIPKKEQFALSEDIKKQMYLISRLMIHINSLRKDRREYFSRISEEFDFLFYLVRLLYKLRYISTKQYMHLSGKVNEVIKICCGWIKNTDSEK